MLSAIQNSTGNTPLLRLNNIGKEYGATILVKQESRNPTGSVKCRVAAALIAAAQKDGKINSKSTIIEPTSGNTGIGLATICASLNLSLILTMPESMSIERRKLLSHLGAQIHLSPAAKGMNGAIALAQELAEKIPDSFIPDQFGNPACPAIHKETTAPEIWQDTQGNIDIFVVGVGTGGTFSGVSSFLKEKNPAIHCVALEPEKSPVISGGKASPHGIQGIGAGFIPKNLDTSLIDEILQVKDEDALVYAQKLASQEGILCGISSGAALWGSLELAKRPENAGKTIVTVLPDTGERYLSTALFQ